MLRTNVCGVEFRNPLMLAAGVMGSNASSMNWILKSGAAGVVSKSFSLEPNPGYANPTTVGVECGIINAIGLSNPGAENFKEELKRIDRKGNVSIASIYGLTSTIIIYLIELVILVYSIMQLFKYIKIAKKLKERKLIEEHNNDQGHSN